MKTPAKPIGTLRGARKQTAAIAEHDQELTMLIQDTYAKNKAANEATKAYNAARKKLYTKMKERGLVETMTGQLLAKIEAPQREKINVEKLKKAVPAAVFLQCISATKKAVENHAGGAVAAICSELSAGEENVTVTLAK